MWKDHKWILETPPLLLYDFTLIIFCCWKTRLLSFFKLSLFLPFLDVITNIFINLTQKHSSPPENVLKLEKSSLWSPQTDVWTLNLLLWGWEHGENSVLLLSLNNSSSVIQIKWSLKNQQKWTKFESIEENPATVMMMLKNHLILYGAWISVIQLMNFACIRTWPRYLILTQTKLSSVCW